jgi:hypothetical protein
MRFIFWTGLQDFSGLTGLGFNHDNPEKSCNPVKNNGFIKIAAKRRKEHKKNTQSCAFCASLRLF